MRRLYIVSPPYDFLPMAYGVEDEKIFNHLVNMLFLYAEENFWCVKPCKYVHIQSDMWPKNSHIFLQSKVYFLERLVFCFCFAFLKTGNKGCDW